MSRYCELPVELLIPFHHRYAVTVRGKVDAETSVTFMITLPHGYPSAGEEKAFPEITAVEGSENVKYKLGEDDRNINLTSCQNDYC